MTWLSLLASIFLWYGLWQLGQKKASGFLFSVSGEILWAVEALNKGMYDLALVCIIFAIMAISNYSKWEKT